jgi:aspartyl-tRNA(Asn)/glutamyl-tRNA(Gln) amidotransferase subunit C
MSIEPKTVQNIARLARLDVPEQDLAPLAGELSRILRFVEQLAEVNTDDVAPMTSVAAMRMPWRADAVDDGGYPDKVLANAPEKYEGFFLVPKVVE